jgi:hypothetical protein
VIDIEATLLQQLLNIAQRKRIAKIPPDRTKYEAGFGLPPFEDRGSGSHLAILSRHQPAALKVATHPNGGYDYAADTRGYTWGAIVEYQSPKWGLRFAEALLPHGGEWTRLRLEPAPR